MKKSVVEKRLTEMHRRAVGITSNGWFSTQKDYRFYDIHEGLTANITGRVLMFLDDHENEWVAPSQLREIIRKAVTATWDDDMSDLAGVASRSGRLEFIQTWTESTADSVENFFDKV